MHNLLQGCYGNWKKIIFSIYFSLTPSSVCLLCSISSPKSQNPSGRWQASPAAGAKKKKVVKTVRRTVTRPKPTVPESSAPPPPAAASSATATDIPSVIEATPTPPAAEAPAPETTPEVSQPAVPETPTSVPETPAAETTPEASQPAVPETPTAVPETPAAEPSEPADAKLEAEKPAAKTTTRVRKVVKKKIIVKKVPKASILVSGEDKNQEEKVAAPPAAEKENPCVSMVANEAPVQQEEAAADAMEQDKDKIDEAMATVASTGDVAMLEGIEAGGDAVLSEGRRRRKTEIFVGGLDREAKEEDIRKVFGKAGEIVEVRMMMDSKTGKNKGYAFLRYANAAQAKKAVAEFEKVQVCGKTCGAAALEGNDTIFLGNIDKTWKKEDIMKLLQESNIEKIDTITVMADPHNADMNRGFAFLELETNRDAQLAYKKLQKKDIFGKGRNVKVAWAEPFNDPDEEEMQKVKSVYLDGIPSSWDENKVREFFKKFGEIERVVLARNIHSAKRKDFAFVNYTTREAAVFCIESFDKEELIDNGSKVTVKVSLAKPVHKDKHSKVGSKVANKGKSKDKPKTVERNSKIEISSNKGKPVHVHNISGEDKKSSTSHELLNVLREQAAWKPEQLGHVRAAPIMQDYTHVLHGGKRPFSAVGFDAPTPDLRAYTRARIDSSLPVTSSSYVTLPHGLPRSSLSYYQRPVSGYVPGPPSGVSDYLSNQRRLGGAPY